MYKKIVLDNGLRIIGKKENFFDSVGIGVWIGTGSRYEGSKINGVSHFLEHMLFKGTKTRSSRDIKVTIEGVGGSLNGFTAEEFSCYLAKVPVKFAELALEVLLDMVLNPKLLPLDIEKERRVMYEELRRDKDQPQHYVADLLDELMWPGNPLGRPIIGSYATLKSICASTLSDYRNEFYTPKNICIAAVGNFDINKFMAKSKKIIPKKYCGQIVKAQQVQIAQASPASKVYYKRTEQTHIAMGLHSIRRDHPMRFALSLLNIILGANMSSRLFNEVREKRGLAYEISTSVKRFDETSAFIVQAGVENSKCLQAVDVIVRELKKIKDNAPGQDELMRAKEFYKGQLAMSLEDSLEHMLWIGEQEMALNKIMAKEDVFKEIDKISGAQITALSKSIFDPAKLNLAVIGPTSDKKGKQIKGLLNNL